MLALSRSQFREASDLAALVLVILSVCRVLEASRDADNGEP